MKNIDLKQLKMQRGEQMKNYNIKIAFSLLFIFLAITSTFADDFKVPDFNGISPQSHINKLYSLERKEELKGNAIKYNDIEDLVHLYNPEILSMWNTWENGKSSNDIANEYADAADRLESSNGDNDVADAMARAQSTGMRIQADLNFSDSYTNFLSNYIAEMNMVLDTKILYFKCFKAENALNTAKAAIGDCERAVNSAQIGFANGASTYADFLTAEKNLSDAYANVTLSESAYNTTRRNLLINCGKPMNENITIIKDDINYIDKIANVNFESDYKKALSNNIQYEIYKRGKDNAVTDEVRKQMDINLSAAETKIYNDLQTKYNDFNDCIEAFKNKSIAMVSAEDSYRQSTNFYNNGNISLNEYLASATKYNTAYNEFNGCVYDINIAYLKYEAAVNGLAAC